MIPLKADPGSYRDVSGQVYRVNGRVLRTINEVAAADFDFVRSSRLLDDLAARGHAVPARLLSSDEINGLDTGGRYVVEHPPLPFISYPYEWPFAALKAAALLHLEIQIAALDRGVALSDASAYNVQFVGTRPTFIDTLSFRRYRPGEFWIGYKQFCEQFLNPLLLMALIGVPYNAWYRGSLDGIPSRELKRLLPLRRRLSRNVLIHVVLQGMLQASAPRRFELKKSDLRNAELPTPAFRRMLDGLRTWIAQLQAPERERGFWRDYARFQSYTPEEATAKRTFVAEFADVVRPKMVWDIGCNTGEYAAALLEGGARYVVGWDTDHGALDAAFERAHAAGAAFTPLFGDAVNPAPAQGWAQRERPGWAERGPADAVVMLALVHHLAIGRNVPLEEAVAWLTDLAPTGIIEFVPKEDVQVKRMLEFRTDIFDTYSQHALLDALRQRARIIRVETLQPSERTLIWFDRRSEAKSRQAL